MKDRRSDCPLSCALELVGDRWTLLVLRDLMRGRERFRDLLAAPEGISTNILTTRLKKLVDAGLVTREGRRYALTAKGRDMRPVILALARWSEQHVPGTSGVPAAWK